MGQGRFVAPRTIEVALHAGGTRTLRGQTVIIDTGSRARIDDTPGLAEARPLTHVEALDLDRVPGHLIVLGGGYVGPRAGAGLPPLRQPRDGRRAERRPDPPRGPGRHRGDRASSSADEGIEVRTGTAVDRVEGRSGESVRLHVARDGAEVRSRARTSWSPSGRTPNTDGIGLEAAGVET